MSEARLRNLLSPARSAGMSSEPTIGVFLREARTIKGFSQKELAEFVGVSTAQWSRIESDINRPSRETLKKTSAYLGVPFHKLVMLSGYSSLKTDDSLYNKAGEIIDTEAIVRSIFCADSDLLDCLSDFKEIGTAENVKCLTFFLKLMRKEVSTASSEKEDDKFFKISFRALKKFIIDSYAEVV